MPSGFLETFPLKQMTEFFHRHPGIFYYSAHRQGIHRIVTRNGDEMRTVAHDDVFAVADNLKSCLFERLHRAEMIDARNLRHRLNRHFHFAHVGTTEALVYGGKIILDGVANVLHRFLLGFSLRPTTWKRWTIHRVTLFRLMKHDLISEAHRRTLYRERQKLQRTLRRPGLRGSPQFQCRRLTSSPDHRSRITDHLVASGALSRRSRREGGNICHQTSPRLRP